jgi:hypothetical protein
MIIILQIISHIDNFFQYGLQTTFHDRTNEIVYYIDERLSWMHSQHCEKTYQSSYKSKL